MRNFLRRCCESKRECITYLIIFLWLTLGVAATYLETDYIALSAYFVSLTGFLISYIFGESLRKSENPSIFLPGPNSRREVIIYITVVLWFIIGLFSIFNKIDLTGVSAYFAALTPFIGSYILGETFKKEVDNIEEKIEQINS